MSLSTDSLNFSAKVVTYLVAVPLVFVVGRSFWHVLYNLFLHPLAKFPGPKTAGLSEWWEVYHTIKCDRFNVIQELHKKHGSVVRINPNQVSIASPKVFHHVFVTKCASFPKSEFYSSIQPGIGPKYAGLFNYTDHKRAVSERRDLQPMFSPAQLKRYEARYQNQLEELVKTMKKTEMVDMFKMFKFLLLDAIGDLSFDQSFNQLSSGEDHQYVIDFNNAFMLIGLDAYFGLQRVFSYSQGQVNKYLDQDVSKKHDTLMSGFLDPKTGQPKEDYDPWSIAISGHGFIIAGSEASSITLAYMLWLLIKKPEMQKKVRSELATLPKNYSSVDLAALPYLDAFLRETLRVYPPAPSPMPRVVPQQGFSFEGVDYPPNSRKVSIQKDGLAPRRKRKNK
ncbi:cytochrome P450 [Halenospora varia]|nr:cytochrome P450 [Halenospora varia]